MLHLLAAHVCLIDVLAVVVVVASWLHLLVLN